MSKNVTIKSFYIRNMLLGYDKQLTTARRLARYRRSLGLDQEETTPPEVKRKQLVERVAREIVENLIISGSDNPIVTDIKEVLELSFNEKLYFDYPPTESELSIYRETETGPQELTPEEKGKILNRLWAITLDKVNETML